ncbi:uncharacterized protein [Halyomorpha halys]|uniref:uncharacterized protein isoform X2 n=1 Tax=Halyomorpha halys TaxID=286706 RepID=UPI0034D1B5CA
MKISTPKLRLHNLVYKCIFLITLSQYSLAGLEVFFDGKKFFYRSNNGKEIPIDMSLGSEITRFQEEFIAPPHRKTRETLHCLNQDPTCNENEEKSRYWQSFSSSHRKPVHDRGTEIVEVKKKHSVK